MKVEADASGDKKVLLGEAVSTNKMILACVLAYCVPGLGHIVLGRWMRGLIFAAAIFSMFALGLFMKGHIYYPIREDFLSIFPSFANVGIGLSYFVCYFLGIGFGEPQAAAATFEYGNTFLWTAGLLNYLTILDAYDIAIGRKS
jgi:hypothetical protein